MKGKTCIVFVKNREICKGNVIWKAKTSVKKKSCNALLRNIGSFKVSTIHMRDVIPVSAIPTYLSLSVCMRNISYVLNGLYVKIIIRNEI
jgi:hypothetical protein